MSTLRQYSIFLKRNFTLFTIGLIVFTGLMGVFEAMGVFRSFVGYLFLAASVVVYAAIGWACRTSDSDEFFVAGRRIPAVYNGMAVAADWMSAASFIGMAGTLYSQGFDGLAYTMGWTGGYVLVALLLAPFLRQHGAYTIPDYFGDRYGGHTARLIAAFATVLCSFVYVVAQIYGVGLIAQRFTGADFAVGVFVGLAGVVVSTFLGGMRAVTWTQVAQFIVLIAAYLIPASMLAYKHNAIPVPQIMYGTVLAKVTETEKLLKDSESEKSARKAMVDISKGAKEKQEILKKGGADAKALYDTEKQKVVDAFESAKLTEDDELITSAKSKVDKFPADIGAYADSLKGPAALAARAVPPRPHAEPYFGKDEQARFNNKINFLALAFCLMVGTASLPHILVRFLTTPTVREARESVFWSLLFILMLYITAPALATIVKFDIYTQLVGTAYADVPFWVTAWSRVDSTLLSLVDYNKDGIIQLAELSIGADLIVLATPEIAGLPFFITGLVAVGGFAAALSTADGLLMAMSTAVSHDVYTRVIKGRLDGKTQARIAKMTLLAFAALSAMVTLQKPGSILFLVAAAFSLAASSLFPALVLGIFWKRTSTIGAIAGMVSGLAITMYYMLRTYGFFIEMGIPKMDLWFAINPIGSGVFGVALGFVVTIVVSLVTPKPDEKTLSMIDRTRYPHKDVEAHE